MKLGSLVLLIWLLIGVAAANQRGYLRGEVADCTKAGTIAATIAAGPLNYVGVNPKVTCKLPEPSK